MIQFNKITGQLVWLVYNDDEFCGKLYQSIPSLEWTFVRAGDHQRFPFGRLTEDGARWKVKDIINLK